ncbi:serine hydrolase domain-containing protein [Kitasatospora kifunensis]|uniref:CubicO group peptidase (Beta-lactamase class C family) n=1 Tax=Kitasatospora kifunensis TaxID=58351 RepID=A0A7W7QY32_KITKI|nr:serine hydrolase domain-containing protein [Kitasatospora kifunensis]MBB4921608.1 CubicO group peptidase (beta-lactamase class C family) [Kitasatospora kifunensis]
MLDDLADFCTGALAEHDCPSVSVAVAERGELVLAQAYGWADLAGRRPATPQTAYSLNSITKSLTAIGTCLAADAGLLDLDAPVPGPYARPGAKVGAKVGAEVRAGAGAEAADWPEPTVRQLLQHRGGLGGYYNFEHEGGPLIDPARYLTLLREPGSGFEYSNLGYQQVGRLLESVTGLPLPDYLRQRLFWPLGLIDLRLGVDYTGPGPRAERYTVDRRAYPLYRSGTPGASAGWGTASSLVLLAQRYAELLKPETLAAMHVGPPVNEHVAYGLGWNLSRGAGPVIHSHGGGGAGVASMLLAMPGLGLSVSVLCNSTDKSARDKIINHVMGELVPGYRPELIAPMTPEPVLRMALPEGHWSGTVTVPGGEVPLELRILADERIEVELPGAQRVTVSAAASPSWALRAAVPLQLPTDDAKLNSPAIVLELRRAEQGRQQDQQQGRRLEQRQEQRLVGVLRVYKAGDGEGWFGNYLTHPCELLLQSS